MIEPFPTGVVVRQALALAGRAPSVRNSQPWVWRVDGRAIDLFVTGHDQTSGFAGYPRDSLISCGIVLQHLRVALSAFGWRAVITRLPDLSAPNHLARVEVEPRPASARDIALASAIPRRRTDRRAYATWPVGQNHLDLIELRCADEGVVVRTTEYPPDVGALLAVTTPEDDASSRLRAGEATGVVLVEATVLGLATCLVTDHSPGPAVRDLPRLRVLAPYGVPQVLVTIGWPAANADPLPPTPRRDVESIAEFGRASADLGVGAA